MTDLVLTRELIQNESALGHNVDGDHVFARSESVRSYGVLVRDALPYHRIARALRFNLLGVKKIHARARTGANFASFPMRY